MTRRPANASSFSKALLKLFGERQAAPLVGDIREEYRRYVRPTRSSLGARAWLLREFSVAIAALLWIRCRAGLVSLLRTGLLGKDDPMTTLSSDVRYASRALRRRPLTTTISVVTLALALGTTMCVLAVFNGVILDPLPYAEPDRLVRIWPDALFPMQIGDVVFLRENATSYSEVAAWGRGLFLLTGDGEPEEVRGAVVFPSHFSMLGAAPLHGRWFVDSDTEENPRPLILSYGLWVRRYGADPSLVGRSIEVSGQSRRVVGVMGPDHQPIEEDWQVWAPMTPREEPANEHRGLAANARLKPGASLEAAESELKSLVRERMTSQGQDVTPDDLVQARLVPLRDWIVGDVQVPLALLLGAVIFVLLVACANVSNLLLAVGRDRLSEMAVRAALGASRWRLLRQLGLESLFLASLGGILGVAISAWVLRFSLHLLPAQIPRTHNISLDGAFAVFSGLLILATALVAGLFPAWRLSASPAAPALKEGTARSGGRSSLRVSFGIVALETAVSIVLIVGAGLLLQSLWSLYHEDPGFEPEGVAVVRLSPSSTRYESEASLAQYYEEVLRSVKALPGAESAGMIQFLPMTPGGWWSSYRDVAKPQEPGESDATGVRVVSPSYFATMKVPLLAGRDLQSDDLGRSPRVAVINENLAQRLWGVQEAPGKVIALGEQGTEMTVVGVVGNVRQSNLFTESSPELYLPFAQQSWRRMHVAIRFATGPLPLAALLKTVRGIDPGVVVSPPLPLREVVYRTIADSRFFAILAAALGTVALILGGVGIYGVMSHAVTLRRREMGIRLALGAHPRSVLRRIVSTGLLPVIVGASAGLALAAGTSSVLQSLLYKTGPLDPAAFLLAPTVLVLVSLMALYLPARRASRLDPVRVLREE